MKAKLLDEDYLAPLVLRWKETPPGRVRDQLLSDFWTASKGLRDMLIGKIAYGGGGMEHDDWHSLLLEKTMKELHKFDPQRGKLYTLLYLAWKRVISSKLAQFKKREHVIYVKPLDDDVPDGTSLECIEETRRDRQRDWTFWPVYAEKLEESMSADPEVINKGQKSLKNFNPNIEIEQL